MEVDALADEGFAMRTRVAEELLLSPLATHSYDTQGRLIDVRGLPPGTEAECPYSRRTFLVPP